MYSVDRYHDISCGHRVYGHESKCAHLHGHNYRVTFECAPEKPAPMRAFIGRVFSNELDDIGRVIDFSVIKQKLCMWLEDEWDHKFLVWEKDPDAPVLKNIDPNGVVITPFNPTAENMAHYLVHTVGPTALQGTGVVLTSCRVEETRKCAAVYTLPNRGS